MKIVSAILLCLALSACGPAYGRHCIEPTFALFYFPC